MLKIRLQRVGKINSPSYRIILTEHARGPKTGNFLELLGTYNPTTKDRSLDTDRIKYWISVGAQPSATMHNMLISAGVTTGKKINVLPKKTVKKPDEPAVAASSPEAKPVVDVPAEASAEVEAYTEESPVEVVA